jgi:hypothetical protein
MASKEEAREVRERWRDVIVPERVLESGGGIGVKGTED